jgi:hypothetical protein
LVLILWIWFLNNCRQDSLLLAFIIILIILFLNFKIIRAVCRIATENYTIHV